MSEEKCCLEKRCKKEHLLCSTGAKDKLVRVGTLFGGQGVCMWCVTHLEMMTKPQIMEEEIETLRTRFPGYARIINETGLEKMQFELRCQWLEVEPTPVLQPAPTPPDVRVFSVRRD